MQREEESGIVYLLREVMFKIYAVCAEVMQILGNTLLLVLYEATLSILRYVRGTLSDDCRCSLPGACNNLHNRHMQRTAFVFHLTGVCQSKALFGPFYLTVTSKRLILTFWRRNYFFFNFSTSCI